MCKLILMHILCSALFYTVSSSYEEQPMYTEATIKINNKKLSNQGKFGKKSPKEKRGGYLYYHNKQKWCSSFGPITTDNSDKWIALIPVGNCTYREKIKVANFYNMSAVIFINNDDTVPKYTGDSSITVSIIVNKETGEELINHVLKRDTYCSIDTGKSIIDRRWKVSRTSVLFVLVSFILLMCISLAWLVFYYVQRFRHIYQNDRKEKQLLGAAKKAISKLKAIPYDSATHEEDETCAVCLEAYKECESLRELPCKHQFHKSCIDPWLLYHRTCPMCKSNILKSLGVEMPPPPAPSTIFSPNLNVSDTDSDRSTMALVTSNVPSAV